ncbi:MAG: RimK/LysX family protein [Actinomycetota bacterium]
MNSPPRSPLIVGWREWVVLEGLGSPVPVKAKIDTGAATSALHASTLERLEVEGEPWVEFTLRPHQRTSSQSQRVRAPMIDERLVRSSSGKSELRPVIDTVIAIGDRRWAVQFTLTRRDAMGFRMLLGRRALRDRAIVDVSRSHVAGLPPTRRIDTSAPAALDVG